MIVISVEETNVCLGIMSYLPLLFYEVKKMRRRRLLLSAAHLINYK